MNFDSSKQYGDWAFVSQEITDGLLSKAKAAFAVDRFIPAEHIHRVKWIVVQPDPGSEDPVYRLGIIGWKYQPKIKKVEA